MKLPPQIAAVVREGHSWPARRSSVHGVSASRQLRSDYHICEHQSTGLYKCNDNLDICKCPNGTCNCCKNSTACQPARDGRGKLTGGCACIP
jgi:hypothetical protein